MNAKRIAKDWRKYFYVLHLFVNLPLIGHYMWYVSDLVGDFEAMFGWPNGIGMAHRQSSLA